MSALFDFDDRDVDTDLVRETREQRRRDARWNHWCEVCHGNLGPGSPCAPDDEEPPEQQEDDDVLAP